MVAAIRSPLAHWAGGASAPKVVVPRGFRSLLAFWAGGAAGYTTAIQPPTPPVFGGSGRPRTRPQPRLDRRRKEEELILLMAATVLLYEENE